jgi:6-phosphogluconolactonase
MPPKLIIAEDPVSVAAERFLAANPRRLILAGGASPRRLYERLAETRHAWAATEVFFSDERCVAPEHPESNYRMVNEALLSKVPARVHRMRGESCDGPAYEEEIKSLFGDARVAFDLALLGLGEDGHTASLFPKDPALEIRDRLVVRVQGKDYPRLTLTLPVFSAAKLVLFFVLGPAKRDALAGLMAGADMPATRIAAQEVIVVADSQAAGGQ